ncbi:MAG: hypothetical protein ACM3ZR_13965 [Pseudomonadota bacterium]
MANSEELYGSRIVLNAVLPLVKVIVESKPALSKHFQGKTGRIQVSALDPDGKTAMHFDIQDGQWTVLRGLADSPDLELEFCSIAAMNSFFAGKSKRLPRIKGWHKLGMLVGFFKSLLTMSGLLSSKEPPSSEENKELMVKLFFYLLSSGISQLNKAGQPEVAKWAGRSPDRVYAWAVTGKPELSAYIRVKAGNSKAARGEYTRSKPFFTMRFDSVDSALGILMQKDNMLESTANGKLTMEGGPEYGAQLGEFMMLVASYVS